MREIEFRQALMSFGKFCGWHYWGFIDGAFRTPAESSEQPVVNAQKHSQEYTGRRDKNGKKIYEGDILRAKSGDFKCLVHFNELLLQWLAVDHKSHVQISPCDWDEREVIGNIYENPEFVRV